MFCSISLIGTICANLGSKHMVTGTVGRISPFIHLLSISHSCCPASAPWVYKGEQSIQQETKSQNTHLAFLWVLSPWEVGEGCAFHSWIAGSLPSWWCKRKPPTCIKLCFCLCALEGSLEAILIRTPVFSCHVPASPSKQVSEKSPLRPGPLGASALSCPSCDCPFSENMQGKGISELCFFY